MTKECSKQYCDAYPYAGAFCELHDEQNKKRSRQRDGASCLLATGNVDGFTITNDKAKESYLRLANYYNMAGSTLRTNKECNGISLELANFIHDWCMGIAEIIWCKEMKDRENWDAYLEYSNEEFLWERLSELDDIRDNATS